jgi:hypothetical protein
MTPSQQFPTAVSLFGPKWRQARKIEMDRHLSQHYSRRSLAALTRALNALARHHGSFQATRHITLGNLADLAAREAADQIHIINYGPAARAAAIRFFSDDPRFQTNSRHLPTALTLGVYHPTSDFLRITEHVAVMNEQQGLAAVTGPIGDPVSVALGRLVAAAPELLVAAKLAHYWLAQRPGEPVPVGDLETIRAAVAQAIGSPDFGNKAK